MDRQRALAWIGVALPPLDLICVAFAVAVPCISLYVCHVAADVFPLFWNVF